MELEQISMASECVTPTEGHSVPLSCGKKYGVIYADPPWRYDSKRCQGAAERIYPTMDVKDICAMPIGELADKDCILFMWATSPCLQDAMAVIDAWGFKYKTIAFNWVKTYRNGKVVCGLGHYTRAGSEICLLAIKGHPKRTDNNVLQVIISPLREHSRKPDEVRRRIERMTGGVERIELFARTTSPGWDVWGNETNKF